MKTLESLVRELRSIPLSTSWYLSSLNESKGKQELYNKQSPQKLKSLKEHALIESSISSNRMEGVNVVQNRVQTIVFGNAILKDRMEEEVRGYQKALRWIHESHQKIDLNLDTILKFHKLIRGEIWDAGKFKEKQVDITEILPNGKTKIRFQPPNPKVSLKYFKKSLELWNQEIQERRIPPLVILCAFNFDFLSIHPFRDGNGRVSRLLLLLQLYKIGFEIGKYISLERIIEENKERYYETLEQSSQLWHEGKNDIWPYGNYILSTIKEAYKQLDHQMEKSPHAQGSKTEMILDYIQKNSNPFSVSDIKYELPGVGIELIRKVLKALQSEKKVKSLSLGRNAKWKRTDVASSDMESI